MSPRGIPAAHTAQALAVARYVAAVELARAVDALREVAAGADPAHATMLRDRYQTAVRTYDGLSGRRHGRTLVGADPGYLDVVVALLISREESDHASS